MTIIKIITQKKKILTQKQKNYNRTWSWVPKVDIDIRYVFELVYKKKEARIFPQNLFIFYFNNIIFWDEMYVHNINCNSKKVFIAIFHLPQKKNIITRFCSAMYILFTILEIKKKQNSVSIWICIQNSILLCR